MLQNKDTFLESFLGQGSNISKNNDMLFYCPIKQHTSKKLSVNLTCDKDGHWGTYHCWVCDFKGRNLLSLLKRLKRYDLIKQYCSNVNNNTFNIFYEEHVEDEPVALPNMFIPLSAYFMKNEKYTKYSNELRQAATYLIKGRDLTKLDIITNTLGITTDEKYYKYVVIPSYDMSGTLNYFICRAYSKYKMRYKNCKHDKDKIIFNEVNIDWKTPLLICEGPFDALKSHVNATCLLGSSLTEKTLLFQRIIENDTKVLLALDSDKTGKEKTLRITNMLLEYDIDVKIFDISAQYKDIGEMSSDTFKQFYNTQLNNNSINKNDYIIRKIETIK